MGDPKKQRKKYDPPSHPWQRVRIETEKELIKKYGFKKKHEIYKTCTILKKIKNQAKKLFANDSEQARKEEKALIKRLMKLGIISSNSKLENILDLKFEDIAERRLQTQLVKKGLARGVKQARQFILHGHVTINEKKINVPSYLVTESDKISFSGLSPFSKNDHPEISITKKPIKVEVKNGTRQ